MNDRMKEQWINDTCMMFQNTFKDINMTTVRNILTLALMDCEITKYTKAVTVYAGEPNEQIIKAFVVAKKVAGASDRTSRPNCVIAWMPLPKPFKVYKMR